ncbi:type I secretion system permease/ATPase [Hydrogenophaga sp.]|uniref:type I secretion system permease/ATPase n=1 Tax=Hydrogenophaga sp. TaxID=1904254 RepID=UPI00272F2F54|nr:type I secretion system permease/ATPase [Hydrogenophaga sp.]MDP2076051.1 type I secretion system permease/ATPase [Hydrogenophaga sp.]MDP3106632.1 type I secretion system permease/ATPase [Hydrogenophaga sp.]
MNAVPSLDGSLPACLAMCAGLAGRPASAASLSAGLALHDGELSFDGAQRAAERAGLALQALESAGIEAALASGDHFIVRNGSTHALIHMRGHEATLMEPGAEASSAPRTLDREELLAQLRSAQAAWCVRSLYLANAPDTELQEPEDRYAWLRRSVLAQWRTYAWVGVSSLVANGLVILTSFYSMQVYDRVIPNNAFATLWALSIGVALIYFFDLIMRVLRAYMIDHAGKKLDFGISSRLFEQAVGMRLSHRPASAGVFANHLNDFESIRDFFTSLTLTTVIDFPFVFVYLAAIAFMGGHLVWVPLLIMPLMLAIAWALQGPIDRAVRTSMQASAQKHGMLIEVIAGIETVKLTASEGGFQGTWERAVRTIAQASMKSKLISTTGMSVVNFLQSISSVVLMIVGVYLISMQQLSMGGLIACSILTSRALAPCSQLASLLSRWKQTRISMDTVAQVFQRPVERPAGKSFMVRDAIDGSVELREVSFAHAGNPMPALSNVSLRIQAGERVAIIGRSGSGKSTLAKLIAGLFEPASGAVLVGGADTRQLDPQQLRRAIGCVPQDPFLFNGTLRENIAYGCAVPDDAALLTAAQQAGVDEFAKVHPQGYDMPVGERGSRLSGGQRQAVVLARALVNPRSVLLLDEPSSSLDHVAEQFLRERLKQPRPGETVVLITHRLGMLDLVDRVIVMHAGQIVMDGPRDTVMQQLKGGAPAQPAVRATAGA